MTRRWFKEKFLERLNEERLKMKGEKVTVQTGELHRNKEKEKALRVLLEPEPWLFIRGEPEGRQRLEVDVSLFGWSDHSICFSLTDLFNECFDHKTLSGMAGSRRYFSEEAEEFLPCLKDHIDECLSMQAKLEALEKDGM